MSTNNDEQTVTTTVPADKGVKTTIRAEVATRIQGIGPTVKGHLLDALAKAEEQRIQNAVSLVFNRLETVETQIRKNERPTVKTFNRDGSVASESFSEEQIKELKKLGEEKERLEKALTGAFEDSKFDKLFEIAGKLGNCHAKESYPCRHE